MTTLMATQLQEASEEIGLARRALTDAAAFAELYQRNVTRVYRYHMAHCGSVKDAEDLTSQTFVAALEGIRSFRGDGSFAAWLMGIASKKRLMYFRGSGSRHEVPLEEAEHFPSTELSTDQSAIQRLQLDDISHALRQISADRADAIALSYFASLTNSEISQVMRKSEAAIKMLISRGLQDLRQRTSHALEVEE